MSMAPRHKSVLRKKCDKKATLVARMTGQRGRAHLKIGANVNNKCTYFEADGNAKATTESLETGLLRKLPPVATTVTYWRPSLPR